MRENGKSKKSIPAEENKISAQTRPPVVVVMGHVDHGKTSLLDYIRKTNVTAKEAGGITQSIGAYEIEHSGKKITFIDTPGHEAFSKMRVRGAQAADLAILVVAADEGVKPQTKEALSQILAAKLPFVVAINKIDKPNINLEKVKSELMTAGVLLEGYGGDVSFQAISAKTGSGINELLDLILLAAEMETLIYNPEAQAKGVVIETQLDNRRGVVVSVVVEEGTLRLGDIIATAGATGKVKFLENFLGKPVKFLEPSSPALILGFESLPKVGEEFLTGKDMVFAAKAVLPTAKKIPMTQAEKDLGKIKLILKADNAGSLEALNDAVRKIISINKPIEVLDQSVGRVGENDFKLANNTGALIIGFRVKLEKAAENLSRIYPVEIINSDIIYKIVEKIEEYALGFAGPKVAGELEVLAVFNNKDKGEQVIGGRVSIGLIRNLQRFEVWRAEKSFAKGKIINLQEQKKNIAEAKAVKEVGLMITADDIIKVGDKLKFFIQ